MACKHTQLTFDVSEHVTQTQYRQPADSTSHHTTSTDTPQPASYSPESLSPAPLILPGDDLALGPPYRGQDVHSWSTARYRNPVTPERKTLYVVDYPSQQAGTEFMNRWAWPTKHRGAAKTATTLKASDIADYISAFYHNLPVRILPADTLRFALWDENPRSLSKLKYGRSKQKITIGLDIGSERLGIETRPAPDGLFERQLSLNHLLEAAIDILPKDAYALLMLVHHDMYEDEDDDFCCGRAYGGSRVCVVSTARYNPVLDKEIGLNLEHAWPNSHCLDYIRSMTGLEEKTTAANSAEHDTPTSPLRMAVEAVKQFRRTKTESNSSIWLGRVCRTASHELGHCFGMGHCVYYACAMQGTASLAEDIRQPPYVCPVDAAKISIATGANSESHMQATLEFCEKRPEVELFVAYGAWLRARLQQVKTGQ